MPTHSVDKPHRTPVVRYILLGSAGGVLSTIVLIAIGNRTSDTVADRTALDLNAADQLSPVRSTALSSDPMSGAQTALNQAVARAIRKVNGDEESEDYLTQLASAEVLPDSKHLELVGLLLGELAPATRDHWFRELLDAVAALNEQRWVRKEGWTALLIVYTETDDLRLKTDALVWWRLLAMDAYLRDLNQHWDCRLDARCSGPAEPSVPFVPKWHRRPEWAKP